MSKPLTVAVIIGSLRKGSWSRQIAGELMSLAPSNLQFNIVEIGALPLYNEDLEPVPPEAWVHFREQIGRADAVLFITPEYNRSVPAVLKNAIDVGSRPYGANVWNGKPAAVVSVSIGALGGFGASHHLRQTLVAVNMHTMSQPEIYIGTAHALFDRDLTLTNDGTHDLFRDFVQAFATWIETVHTTELVAA